jgi:hypothetical protein
MRKGLIRVTQPTLSTPVRVSLAMGPHHAYPTVCPNLLREQRRLEPLHAQQA